MNATRRPILWIISINNTNKHEISCFTISSCWFILRLDIVHNMGQRVEIVIHDISRRPTSHIDILDYDMNLRMEIVTHNILRRLIS